MKHSLVLASLLIVVATLNAEVNPFALEKNLQKIDADKELLLSTLKSLEQEIPLVKKEIKKKVFSQELVFLKLLVSTQSRYPSKSLDYRVKRKLKHILREKNNPKFKISNMLKMIAGDKVLQSNFSTYLYNKVKILKASKQTRHQKSLIHKSAKDFFVPAKMKGLFKKHPVALKKLGIAALEDMVRHGIPQANVSKKPIPKVIKAKVAKPNIVKKRVVKKPIIKKRITVKKTSPHIVRKAKIRPLTSDQTSAQKLHARKLKKEQALKKLADEAYQKAILSVD